MNMVTIFLYSLFSLVISFSTSASESSEMRTIFNFNSETDFSEADASSWWESSDTVRTPGMSKASFVLQKSRLFQRAIFFALLNPQPNGAGFAGVKTNLTLENPSDYFGDGLMIQCRAQGNLKYWKFVLTNKEFSGQQADYSYEAKFQVDLNSAEFERVSIPFSDFKAYYRGAVVLDAPPLDLGKIGIFGLQTFGGVYDEFKQTGVGSLEMDFISVY